MRLGIGYAERDATDLRGGVDQANRYNAWAQADTSGRWPGDKVAYAARWDGEHEGAPAAGI